MKKKYILDKIISKYQINNNIKYKTVKLVGSNLLENKIYNLNFLLDLIKKKNIKLDLMLINDKNIPPLVKILNFNKYLYDFKKKYKKNLNYKYIKILRLSPQISDHDIEIKIKKAKKFLEKKYKVKFYVFFKGRSIIYKKKGENILMNCYNNLKQYGDIEKYPYMEYNKMFIIIKPKNYKIYNET